MLINPLAAVQSMRKEKAEWLLSSVKSVQVRITAVKSVETSSRAITCQEREVQLPKDDQLCQPALLIVAGPGPAHLGPSVWGALVPAPQKIR